jgi:site-specific recombinase XerD
MSAKNLKTTTYSLEWDTVINLESRLLRDFLSQKTIEKSRQLLMISIGTRLGLRVIDNLNLKWMDLMELQVGERFVRIEKKTNKERVLVMSTNLKEILDSVIQIIQPNPDHFIFTSQKGKGLEPMSIQCFNRILKIVLTEYKIRFIGNCSSHLLRKSFVVGSIKKGFENGDHLSLIKVSRLIGHSNINTTLRYTNFEASQSFGLYELD